MGGRQGLVRLVVAGRPVQGDAEFEPGRFAPGGHPHGLEAAQRVAQALAAPGAAALQVRQGPHAHPRGVREPLLAQPGGRTQHAQELTEPARGR
ncbi:hypothetical protein GCM10018785_05750 [Streptomyces longispororuber]|uniref:Uncharacterized protein n=1 Tax=Streptomyces longispororuber TaxID=68230 RepID=A0A918Z6X4_9ACTN|nr:hypothetical protein GCM10018785_05750 [Streptomyces longispororuber]